MRKNNKKGFTIVELVIVIAVIAILAGVLIPTFASIIEKANESKALQEATNAYKEAYAEAISDGTITAEDGHAYAADGETITWTFTFTNATTVSDVDEPDGFGYVVTVESGKVKVVKNS